MTSGHILFIPGVLLVGMFLGFILGTRAARNQFDLEQKREAEREAARAARAARKDAAAKPTDAGRRTYARGTLGSARSVRRARRRSAMRSRWILGERALRRSRRAQASAQRRDAGLDDRGHRQPRRSAMEQPRARDQLPQHDAEREHVGRRASTPRRAPARAPCTRACRAPRRPRRCARATPRSTSTTRSRSAELDHEVAGADVAVDPALAVEVRRSRRTRR